MLKTAICLFLFGTFISFSAYGQDTSKQAADAMKYHLSEPAETVPQAHIRLGPGISMVEGLNGAFGFGGQMDFSFRMADEIPVYVGLDISFFRWSVYVEKTMGSGDSAVPYQASEDLSAMSVMGTIYYRFRDRQASGFHPYFGLSLGPSLVYGGDGVKIGSKTLAEKTTQLELGVIFRPGIEISLTRTVGIHLEPRVGIFSGQFMFAPHAGVVFGL